MNKYPKISIVMSAYNSSKYIGECIESVINQTFTDFEFIIVDDKSSDNTVDTIKLYTDKRIRLIEAKEHNFIKSLNKGMSAATGKYIARMDSDDIMYPERLQTQYDYMESNQEIDICGGWVCLFSDDDNTTEDIVENYISHQRIINHLLTASAVFNPTVILRKESLQRFDPSLKIYEEEFVYVEDYRLWTILALADFKFANIPEPLIKYRLSPNQITTQLQGNIEQEKRQLRTQSEYIEGLLSKIVEEHPDLYTIAEDAIIAYNTGKIDFYSFRDFVSSIMDALKIYE